MEEDEFDEDDSFGALPDETLRALEESAISSTQIPKTTTNTATTFGAQHPRIHTYGTTGISRNNVSKKPAWRPPQPRKSQQPQAPTDPPASAPPPPSSDYGFLEETVIDLAEPPTLFPTTTPKPLPTRAPPSGSRPPARYTSKSALDEETIAAFAAADAELAANNHHTYTNDHTAPPGEWHASPPPVLHQNGGNADHDITTRFSALETAHARLQLSEHEARAAAQRQAGEIAIVRANAERARKEYEARIAGLLRERAEEREKLKAEVERGKREREVREVERGFEKWDAGVAKSKSYVEGRRSGGGTPKKSTVIAKGLRIGGLGDGFEDDEVGVGSPSRSREKESENQKDKSREQTPKVGNKRKRAAVQDSPLPALSFSGPPPPSHPTREESAQTTTSDASLPATYSTATTSTDETFAFLQKLLNHNPHPTHEGTSTTLATLSTLTLPSNPTQTLTSHLLSALSTATTILPPAQTLTNKILHLWSHTLTENFYPAIPHLLTLLNLTTSLSRATELLPFIPSAVPFCIRTIEVLANPTARAAMYPDFARGNEWAVIQADVAPYIDIDVLLGLLERFSDAASAAGGEGPTMFWQGVNERGMLILLHGAMGVERVGRGLRILREGALDASFGPASRSGGRSVGQKEDGMERGEEEEEEVAQARREMQLLDRLMNLLFESLVPPPSLPPASPTPRKESTVEEKAGEETSATPPSTYSEAEILGLRLQVLNVLLALAKTRHGVLLLRAHKTAVGKVVRFLERVVAALYTARPSVGLAFRTTSPPPAQERNGRPNDDGEQEAEEEYDEAEPSTHDLLAQNINTAIRLLYLVIYPSPTATRDDVNNDPPFDLYPKLRAVRGGYHKWLVAFTRVAFSDQLVLEAGIESEVVEAAHRVLDEVLSPEEGEGVVGAVEGGEGSFYEEEEEVGEDGEV